MNAVVARHPRRRVSFEVPYACECGQARIVFAHGIAAHLPLARAWRPTGPCRQCGKHRRWRILTRASDYIVQIEPLP